MNAAARRPEMLIAPPGSESDRGRRSPRRTSAGGPIESPPDSTAELAYDRRALDELEAAHSEQLRVVHTLSREGEDFSYAHRVRAGRDSRELIEEFIEDTDSALFYVCGPAISPFEVKRARERGQQPVPRFMESTLAILDALGVTKDRIKRESYG